MNYNRLFAICLLSTGIATVSMADTNPSSNNSATQFKTGNRNASVGAEAAFYNPAGTVFGKDGFQVEFSVLPFTSSQSIYDSGMDKTYKSVSSSMFYPAINLTYKKDKLAFFSNVGITNGGGAGNYDDGLPSFERLGMYNIYQALLGGAALPSTSLTDYSYKSNFKGSAYGVGGSFGVAYRFNNWLSGSVALQYSHQMNHQEGELDITYPAANDLSISKTEINVDYTGSNLGYIVGLNIKPIDKLLIAQTFRYYSELELTTTVNDDKDGDGMFVDGSKTKSTYVPCYSLGLSYQLSDNMRFEADMNVSLYSMLDLDQDANGVDQADYYNNGYDFGLGLEYQLTSKLNLGLGGTFAPKKMKQEYMSEMEFETTSLWLNTGATYQMTPKIALNCAIQAGVPTEKITQDYSSYYQEYKKDVSLSLGLGVVYSF